MASSCNRRRFGALAAARLHDLGAQVGGGSAVDFRRFAADQYRRDAEVVRSRDIKVE